MNNDLKEKLQQWWGESLGNLSQGYYFVEKYWDNLDLNKSEKELQEDIINCYTEDSKQNPQFPLLHDGGLKSKERKIMDKVNEAWAIFNTLDQTHPSDKKDFCDAVHQIQKIVGMRVLRRDYPKYWINKGE